MVKLSALLFAFLSATSVVQAAAFKCQTPQGITYSESPCPSNSTSSTMHMPHAPTSIGDINNVPLPAPDKQRVAYQSYLSLPKPKAFFICKDDTVRTINGTNDFLQKQMANLREIGCVPYAIDNQVVWEGH